MLELMKYFVRQSEYDLPVIVNLLNGLLPAVNETWARNLTKQLREEILVGTQFCAKKHYFFLKLRKYKIHYSSLEM